MHQLDDITDICFACGTGGTAAGLAIANYLYSQQQHNDAGDDKRVPRRPAVRLHAISVCDNADYFYRHVQQIMSSYGLPDDLNARSILNVIDGYKAPGYAKSLPVHLELIRQVASSTGVVLDPVYTGKALYGMLKEIDKIGNNVFAGNKLLFIMTGGVFANFDGRWNDQTLLSAAQRSSHMQICRE